MEAARDHLLPALAYLVLSGCAMSQTSELEQANALVASYGRHIGVADARLGGDNDRAFGSCGFYYDEKRHALVGRAYVSKSMIKSASKQGQENYRRLVKTLNDPKIGGMFEQGGATFVLDEEKEILFMVKEFPVASTDARTLRTEMDELQNLAATWTVRWLGRMARIMHGHLPPPTAPVTRKNDTR